MNGLPYQYPQSNMMPPLSNNFFPQQPNIADLRELENRVNHLERQIKRLETKVFANEENMQNDYSAFPPKDSGMYMM